MTFVAWELKRLATKRPLCNRSGDMWRVDRRTPRVSFIKRQRFSLIGLAFLSACSSAPPPRKVAAVSEPQLAEDLPTWCSESKKPCVPTRDFATRLCRGRFTSAALFLFQKQTPWQRRWVKPKEGVPARNGEGGPTGGALVHGEEVLVMAVDEPVSAAVEASSSRRSKSAKKPDPDILALRWDGTCVSLKGSEAVTHLPGKPKNPQVDWTKLDLFVQRSLAREAEIRRGVEAREQACAAATSADCQKAEEALSNSIVASVRRGAKLSMPEQRP